MTQAESYVNSRTTRRGSHADVLETDGNWCPMAHGNRLDDSCQNVPPLRAIREFQKIADPRVSPKAFIHLGAFTGREFGACVYDSPLSPALVTYRYRDGSILWTSPQQDLQGSKRRMPSGILLARMGVRGQAPRRYVFAGNPAEIVCYTGSGRRAWKLPATEVTEAAPDGVGMPTSITFNDSRELVTVTTKGWVLKIDPVNGGVIDHYRMDAQVYVGGRLYHGTFVTRKSVLVVGDTLYVLANFRPHPSTPLHPTLRPVHLLRIRLNGAEGGRRIKPLSQPRNPSDPCPDRIRIGLFSGSASPSAWVDPAGHVQIFAQAHALIAGDLHATITAVRDDGSQLKRSWWCAFGAVPDDGIYSAPAFHAPTRTLIVCTMGRIYVLSRVGERVGLVPRPVPLRPEQLLSPSAVNRMARVRVGSPLAVTYDHDRDEIVVYTNFRVLSALTTESFGLMGGFALKSRGGPPAPLWHHPLAISRDGKIEPGPGTLGQPALFQYPGPTGPSQGLIVNTVRTGTYVFR